ncbi:hypothetical protein ABZ716_16075 [Streptomyces sp. NPDC006687]|uniref:hypothetical protein n=1 Tax=unclassified Streptomyces TaxID=2593676 RepID=UPI0033FDA4AE
MADEKPVTAPASLSDCFSAAAPASGPCPTARRLCGSRKITGICRKVDPWPRPEKAKATRKPAKNDQKLPWSPPEGSAKRFRWAARRPVDCQEPSSSGRQSPMRAPGP